MGPKWAISQARQCFTNGAMVICPGRGNSVSVRLCLDGDCVLYLDSDGAMLSGMSRVYRHGLINTVTRCRIPREHHYQNTYWIMLLRARPCLSGAYVLYLDGNGAMHHWWSLVIWHLLRDTAILYGYCCLTWASLPRYRTHLYAVVGRSYIIESPWG